MYSRTSTFFDRQELVTKHCNSVELLDKKSPITHVFASEQLSALKACPPAEQPYRASRTNSFFMMILLIAFFLCTVPVGYSLYKSVTLC